MKPFYIVFVLLGCVCSAPAQQLTTANTGNPLVARDGTGNIVLAYATSRADLPVSEGAAQPRFSGGTCISSPIGGGGGGQPTAYLCPDLYVAKYSADGATFLRGTYLGGMNIETALRLIALPNGDVLLTGTSISADFLDRLGSGGGGFAVRLSGDLTKIAAARRFAANFEPSELVAGDDIAVAGRMGTDGNVVYSLAIGDFSERWKRVLPDVGGVVLRGAARLSGGDLVVGTGATQGPFHSGMLRRVRAADGEVAAARALPALLELTSVAALPGDGMVIGGVSYANRFDAQTHVGVGFVQRFDGGLVAAEEAQAIGERVTALRADAAGLIEIWGLAAKGLATSAEAPVRCHGEIGDLFYGELPYAVGRPTFVTYVGLPALLSNGLVGFAGEDPVLRIAEKIVLASRPKPGARQGICLDTKVQSYAVTLDRASYTTNGIGYLRSTVARGELVTAFGAGLSDGDFVSQPELSGSIPRGMGDTRFLVDGVAVGIVELHPNSATLAMPFGLGANTTVAVERAGERAAPLALQVVSAAPMQLITGGIDGDRLGVYLRGEISTSEHRVLPGDEVTVYLVGGGVLDRDLDEAVVVGEGALPRAGREVKALVEGFGYQQVLYAGAVRGQLPGLMQVNVKISTELKYVNELTLSIFVDGKENFSHFWAKQP